MALFRNNDPFGEEEYLPEDETDYDDGFDELTETEEPETSEEERQERRRTRFRLALGASNLVAVIGGAVAILVLLTLLFSMINFVNTDMTRNFTLFEKNF